MNQDEQFKILIQENQIIQEFQEDIQDVSRKAILKIFGHLTYQNYVLAISHSNYLISLGGTEKVLHEEQTELAARQISYIQMYACYPNDDCHQKTYLNQMVCVNIDSVPAGNFTIIQIGLILQLLNLNGMTHAAGFHLHHLMNLSVPGIKHLIQAVHADKVRVFIHDYYTLCPQFNLLRNGKEYCGETLTDEACNGCELGEKRKPHIALMRKFFVPTPERGNEEKKLNAEIIAPSAVAADIWKTVYPEHEDHIRLIPHQILTPLLSGVQGTFAHNTLRIAYLGYESFNKGLETWWRLTADSSIKSSYELFHLGASGMNIPGVRYIPVSFLNDGPNAMVNTLKKHKIDIAFLWSVWQETYSFTLHEAFAANAFVITNPLSGNIAAQINGTSRGMIFHDEAEMFHFLRDVFRVQAAVYLNQKENSPVDLKFNPQLAIESANGLTQCRDGSATRLYGELSTDSFKDYEYLLRKLEIETHLGQRMVYSETSGEPQTDYEVLIHQLRTELDVYHISRLHRIAEAARQYMNTHMPFIAAILKKIFFIRH